MNTTVSDASPALLLSFDQIFTHQHCSVFYTALPSLTECDFPLLLHCMQSNSVLKCFLLASVCQLQTSDFLPFCHPMQKLFTPNNIRQLRAPSSRSWQALNLDLFCKLWDSHKTQTDLYIHVLFSASCGTFFPFKAQQKCFQEHMNERNRGA